MSSTKLSFLFSDPTRARPSTGCCGERSPGTLHLEVLSLSLFFFVLKVPVVEKTDVSAATATQLRLSMFCRTNAAFPLAGVDHFVREEVVLQPFYRLVRT